MAEVNNCIHFRLNICSKNLTMPHNYTIFLAFLCSLYVEHIVTWKKAYPLDVYGAIIDIHLHSCFWFQYEIWGKTTKMTTNINYLPLPLLRLCLLPPIQRIQIISMHCKRNIVLWCLELPVKKCQKYNQTTVTNKIDTKETDTLLLDIGGRKMSLNGIAIE